MVNEEILTKNLGFAVKLINANDKKKFEVFTNDEIKKLIQYQRGFNENVSTFLVVIDTLIINFLVETGCRNHELTNLKYEDIKEGYIYLKVTKNSKTKGSANK